MTIATSRRAAASAGTARAPAAGTAGAIFRPIQYLGSKLRVVDAITAAARDMVPAGARAVDLFAGSSVVGQALARAGYAVTSIDTQEYAVIFSRALLGVGRGPGEALDPSPVVARARLALDLIPRVWREGASREEAAVARGDAAALRTVERDLPLAWRLGRHLADREAPLASFYAGSYFGVRQALALDCLRGAIEGAADHPPGGWWRAAAMTALMHAASIAVHSAGKHFAQPLKARAGNATFLDRRLLSDRSIDVFEAFVAACAAIAEAAPASDRGHEAVRCEAETHLAAGSGGYALHYLDPPYTGQQYSRFYHVLETIASGDLPSLPRDAAPTSGLYPAERYKSAFSSRRRAPIAMRQLLERIAASGSAAIVSYSASAATSDGNARMITLEELLSACRQHFGPGRVEVADLEHRYRQFNSVGNANVDRDDREVLVLCRPASSSAT